MSFSADFLLVLIFRFPVDERGTMKSVVEYFYETYGFVIQHTQWPCLQVGNAQRPNYLPMEVKISCYNNHLAIFWDVPALANILSGYVGLQDSGGSKVLEKA